LSSTNPDFTLGFEGEVTCLNVVGNTAFLAGTITRSEGLAPGFDQLFHVQATDGGQPTAGTTPDAAIVSTTGTGVIDPINCTVAAAPAFQPTVDEHGNLVVRDDTE
jgi:hypothetical protein